jgi:hypothetical protein
MSTEPPVGDDLQQMIGGMRARFVEHLDAEPRRVPVRRRVGIVVAVVALLGVGTASGAVALGMIPQPFAAAPVPATTTSPTQPPPVPTASSAPVRPTTRPTPTPVSATIPASCATALSAADSDRIFGGLVREQLRPAGPGVPAPYWVDPAEPFVADATLVCRWSSSGSPEEPDSLFLAMGTTPAATLTDRLRTHEDDGWSCSDRLGGRACQQVSSSEYYGTPLETTMTFFVRGDTYISVTQTNTPTDGLLDALVERTWS